MEVSNMGRWSLCDRSYSFLGASTETTTTTAATTNVRCVLRLSPFQPVWSVFPVLYMRTLRVLGDISGTCKNEPLRCVSTRPLCTEKILIEPQDGSMVAIQSERSNVIQNIFADMRAIKAELDGPAQWQLVSNMFEYICQHMDVVGTCSRLRVTIQDKLIKFHDDGWYKADGHINRMFGYSIYELD